MIIIFVGYSIVHDTITQKHEKEVGMLVLDVQNKSDKLISKLLYQYTIQKDILIEKHKEVASYLEKNSYDVNLEEIKRRINKDHKDARYEVYITDKNLTIKNTTYRSDLGLNLSFAKRVFDEHYDKGVIGCSSPILAAELKSFLSYSDSYYSKDGDSQAGVLQVSYSYSDSIELFQNLKNQIAFYNNHTDLKAYVFVDYGYKNDLLLQDTLIYKPELKEVEFALKNNVELLKKLKNSTKITKSFIENGTRYKAVFVSSQSEIMDDMQIIHTILIDESKFVNKLISFNILMLIVSILGIVAIFIVNNIRKKETRLSEQDKFIQSSMHEIKTPLSIITLNNELRELEFGHDEYSIEINNAIKLLKISYDDMSYAITKDELGYDSEIIELDEIISNRVEYFQTIAKITQKTITLKVDSACQVEISRVEIVRLIDNNLSNAIKYGDINSNIDIILKNNLLSFHSRGKIIKNISHIFDKYYRENDVVGGHGLGLSIVSDIAKKYLIHIELESDNESGTTFTYKFKCHTDDTSKE